MWVVPLKHWIISVDGRLCLEATNICTPDSLLSQRVDLRFLFGNFHITEAIVFYDDNDEKVSLRNREVRSLSEKCASLLRSCGVHKGDVVCNLLPGSMEREVTNFGILLAGKGCLPCIGIRVGVAEVLFYSGRTEGQTDRQTESGRRRR